MPQLLRRLNPSTSAEVRGALGLDSNNGQQKVGFTAQIVTPSSHPGILSASDAIEIRTVSSSCSKDSADTGPRATSSADAALLRTGGWARAPFRGSRDGNGVDRHMVRI
jgi:hypothetical protein